MHTDIGHLAGRALLAAALVGAAVLLLRFGGVLLLTLGVMLLAVLVGILLHATADRIGRSLPPRPAPPGRRKGAGRLP